MAKNGWGDLDDDFTALTEEFWPDLTLDAVEEDVAAIASTVKLSQEKSLRDPVSDSLFEQIEMTLAQLRYQLDARRIECMQILNSSTFDSSAFTVSSRPTIRLVDRFIADFSPSHSPSDKQDASRDKFISSCLLPQLPQFLAPELFRGLDEDVAQNTKDLARDVIVVNGRVIKGASTSYFEIRQALSGMTGSDSVASTALTVAARTFSGGVSFQRVLTLFDPPPASRLFIVPESAAAAPLEILAGPGKALVRAHTQYSVRATELEDSRLVVLDAWLVACVGAECSSGVIQVCSNLE